jgi:hypothetical protein
VNRRDFVSRGLGAAVAVSLTTRSNLTAAQSPSPGVDHHLNASERTLIDEKFRVSFSDNGTIRSLEVRTGADWEEVKFRSGLLAGPAWADVPLQKVEGSELHFDGIAGGIRHSLRYRLQSNRLEIIAGLKNEGTTAYAPKAARLVLGIDSEMKSFPSWNDRHFPTLLRCEKTHFWGYLMTPKGRIMTIGSPDPVASYNMNYDESIWSGGNGGHMIRTCSLDLMHALPLPSRHPQNLTSIPPGQERIWTIYLQPAESLESIKPLLASSLAAPMIDADRYTLGAGESSKLTIFTPLPVSVAVMAPDGSTSQLALHAGSKGRSIATFTPLSGVGIYQLTATAANGHQSQACIYVRQPWSWYLEQARRDTLINKQYASSHLEQWLGLETDVLAHRHIPDPALDTRTDRRLKEILNLQWDLITKKPKVKFGVTDPMEWPIEVRFLVNTAQMAGVLAHRYRADHDPYWLDLASGFADYVVGRQYDDGNYDNYTTVAYPVKSVMTVMAVEKVEAAKDTRFSVAYDRHYNSARKAMDFLVRSQDNLTTEGENTFEDGMISCSGLQLGLFALLQTNDAARDHYAQAARKMLFAHHCLEQLLIPDCRMNGATLRFWEAQYDTLIGKSLNMMDSPHGWSAWLIPALWYQYLLTGEEVWLEKAMNAMGSCAQLIDGHTGQLRWAFVPDPYREVTMLEPDSDTPGRGRRVERTIGEQYVPMIASFHYPDHEPIPGDGWDSGWTSCNDVHEVFIAMEEVALTSAYVIERTNGELAGWNCKVTKDRDGLIRIEPAESIVNRVHLNLRRSSQIRAVFANVAMVSVQAEGLHWIGPGGVPELLR